MVVICGVEVNPKTLPYEKAIEYVVKPREVDVRMLLKTNILQKCTEIYSTYDMVSYIPSNCRSKTFLIKDAAELQEKLLGQPQSDYMEQLREENTPLPKKETVAEKLNRKTEDDDASDGIAADGEDIFDVGSDDFEMLLQNKDDEIRNRDEIIEKLQAIIQSFNDKAEEAPAQDNTELLARITELETALAEKDAIIADAEMQTYLANEQEACQNDVVIADLNSQIEGLQTEIADLDAVISDKDTALLEKDDLLAEANRTVEQLNEKISVLSADNADLAMLSEQLETVTYDCNMYKSDCEKYQAEVIKVTEQLKRDRKIYEQDKAEYEKMLEQYESEQQSSALLTMLSPYLYGKSAHKPAPTFTTAELNRLQALNFDNISLVCFGAGASMTSGLRGVQTVLNKGEELLLIDCTGDAWLPSVLKLEKKAGIMLNTNGNLADMAITRGRTQIIRTNAFDDIQLLTYDWVGFLEKMVKYANGRKTMLLLGSIKSFAVKYTVLKLAQVLVTTVIVKADPYSAQSLYWDLLNTPAERLTLGVLEYTPVVKQIFDSFITKYNVKITKTNDISEVIYQK